MYVIREKFTARPGMASKLSKMLKDAVPPDVNGKVRVLTDAVGTFNTVVMETEVSDLGEFEKRMREYSQRKDIQEKMKGYTDMYVSGSRKIYQVV